MLPNKPPNHTPHYTTFPMDRLCAANDAMLKACATLKEWRDSVPPSAKPLAGAINSVMKMLTETGLAFSALMAIDESQRENCECTSDDPQPEHYEHHKQYKIEDMLPERIKNRLKNRLN